MESAVLAPILSDSNPWYIPGLNDELTSYFSSGEQAKRSTEHRLGLRFACRHCDFNSNGPTPPARTSCR